MTHTVDSCTVANTKLIVCLWTASLEPREPTKPGQKHCAVGESRRYSANVAVTGWLVCTVDILLPEALMCDCWQHRDDSRGGVSSRKCSMVAEIAALASRLGGDSKDWRLWLTCVRHLSFRAEPKPLHISEDRQHNKRRHTETPSDCSHVYLLTAVKLW